MRLAAMGRHWAAGRVNEFPAGDAGVCEDFGELQ
jgi:hypothetical protein